MEPLEKILLRESSAVEQRNWIRLTSYCNNRCTFCLDSDAHDGTVTGVMNVKAQILAGRKAGATRLILSGGEPTIHPNFVDFVRFGRALGYRRIQTVTNGRMFAYPEFTRKAIDAGLGEVTFSVHGHTAKLHDALVGCPGAFDEELRGIDNVLADGRAIVNIDVCLNRRNVPHLRELMETFIARGIYEFDLLQIIPFGRAWSDDYRDILFYDVEEAHPHIQRALELKSHPLVHIWTNRFPLPYLEGHEELIQDPHKLFDEVRGRMAQFDAYLDRRELLSCREPARCKHCFLHRFCDGFFATHARLSGETTDVDPATREAAGRGFDLYRIDLRGGRAATAVPPGLPRIGATLLLIDDAKQLDGIDAASLPGDSIWIDAARVRGLAGRIAGGRLGGKAVDRVIVRRGDDVAAALALGTREVKLILSDQTAAWIEEHLRAPVGRLIVGVEAHELLSDTAAHAVDLGAFFARWTPVVPIEDVPRCLAGPAAVAGAAPSVLDATMIDERGRFVMAGYVSSFVVDAYYAKSLRCEGCVENARCRGLHVNHVRRFGFRQLEPIHAAR